MPGKFEEHKDNHMKGPQDHKKPMDAAHDHKDDAHKAPHDVKDAAKEVHDSSKVTEKDMNPVHHDAPKDEKHAAHKPEEHHKK